MKDEIISVDDILRSNEERRKNGQCDYGCHTPEIHVGNACEIKCEKCSNYSDWGEKYNKLL